VYSFTLSQDLTSFPLKHCQTVCQWLSELQRNTPEQVSELKPKNVAKKVPKVMGLTLQPSGSQVPFHRNSHALTLNKGFNELWKRRGRNTQDDVTVGDAGCRFGRRVGNIVRVN
jgi:hypothetical protein